MTSLAASRFRVALARAGLAAIAAPMLVLLASIAGAAPALAADVPYLSGRVVDDAEIMSAPARERVAAMLKAHEDRSGDQVVVLTVPTLDGESIEGYATRVFEAWKLGQKGKDNGVLMIVVPKDRRMRIEVGYGLEGTLTDVASSRIIRNVMTPQFKEERYDEGIEDGAGAIVAQLEGTASLPSEPQSTGSSSSSSSSGKMQIDGPNIPFPMNILVGAFVFGVIGLFTIVGVLTPGMGWFLYLFLIPFWAMFPLFVVGAHPTLFILGTYIVGFPIAKLIVKRQPWYDKAARDLKSKGTAQIGGFTVTSSSGGSWSSSGGGGGFSGGGGSSGGGGASGSW